MAARYERCKVNDIRRWVETKLKLAPFRGVSYGGQQEAAADFWARVEKAGLLQEALALYDKKVAELATRRHLQRETKQQFAQRVEREGRQEEVEPVRAELLASGLTQRD